MPLIAERVVAELERRRDDFLAQDVEFTRELAALTAGAEDVRRTSAADLTQRLGGLDADAGAFPTVEWDGTDGWWRAVEASQKSTHEAWRRWAMEVLDGVTTCAADGSQIYPSTDWSVPIGAVQVGTFINHHRPGAYRKDLRFEALAAADLQDPAVSEYRPREIVDLRRFEAECTALREWMEDPGEAHDARLAIFDGSLIVSFAANPTYRRRYVAAVTALLEASERRTVPLVGYIDASRARDLGTMIAAATPGASQPTRVTDGVWLPDTEWGDRTSAFVSARRQGLEGYGDYRRAVAFCYLKASTGRRPARLEFPRWVIEADRTEWMVDVVRAEIVAQAAGYPYAVETTDALAVLTQADRDRFQRIFQDFAARHGLRAYLSGKAASKRRRR